MSQRKWLLLNIFLSWITYPPQQILLGGRVQDFWYLQVGIHAETMLWGSGGGRTRRGAVGLVSLSYRLHVRVLWRLHAEEKHKKVIYYFDGSLLTS